MKNKKRFVVWAVVLLLIGGYFISQNVYDDKYDGYYEKVLEQSIQTAAEDGTLKLRIDIEEEQIEYHHLGKDITKEYTCNGRKVKSGDIVPYDRVLYFTATITEHDSIDDVGTEETTMWIPTHSQEKTIFVRVDEKGGRKYPDAYAIWKITFEVEPVVEDLEIGFWEVVFS